MKQFQVAIVRLKGKAREDEDTLTDLLNERARGGWDFRTITQLESERLAVVFERNT